MVWLILPEIVITKSYWVITRTSIILERALTYNAIGNWGV